MYHQIDKTPAKKALMRGLVVSPASFSRQMAAMRALGYKGLSMGDLEPYLLGEREGKVFGITFDDGYENNLHHALPILKGHGFTSTCYVVADLIGRSNIWDAERGVRQVPLMTLTQVQAWIDAGQEVGSHSLSHPNLTRLTESGQFEEITRSRIKVEALVNQAGGVRHFCYPYGQFDQISVQCARDAGYSTATTTVRGRVAKGDGLDMLLLPRVLVSRTTTWMQLLVKCFTRYEDRRGVDRVTSGGT